VDDCPLLKFRKKIKRKPGFVCTKHRRNIGGEVGGTRLFSRRIEQERKLLASPSGDKGHLGSRAGSLELRKRFVLKANRKKKGSPLGRGSVFQGVATERTEENRAQTWGRNSP